MSATEKYKIFRNYMTNELGITSEDIRAWTQEAVSIEVAKIVGQLNLPKLAEEGVQRALKDWAWTGTKEIQRTVAEALGKELTKQLRLSVVPHE